MFYFLVAEFLSSVSRHVEACEQRIIAAELSPDDYSLAVSVATALRLLDRKNEAEKWYRTVCYQIYESIHCSAYCMFAPKHEQKKTK